ncbi:MAG TPA: class I SAM-dependent methyltransferase [Flavobacteriales bacterium]|nr:class I SAM-dependent methyltransferase [Flavobacteriales bacterium]
MSNSEYWNNRARKFGHTGWANYSIYAFDQLARLKAIESILTNLKLERNLALDFGTGSGDFARILSKSFKKVIAFDTSEKVVEIGRAHGKDLKNIDFCSGNSVMDLAIGDGSLDLILSVTVLGHLMDNNQLSTHLHFFNTKLANNGRVIALEYTPANKPASTEYQNFLTLSDWQDAFAAKGFNLDDCVGFYSPTQAPCSSFDKYKRYTIVKILRFFQRFEWPRAKLDVIANKFVNDNDDYFWPSENDDLLKIMVFKKS